MKKLNIPTYGEIEYKYFFDIDLQSEGVSIYIDSEYIGDCFTETSLEEETDEFISFVSKWLDENY